MWLCQKDCRYLCGRWCETLTPDEEAIRQECIQAAAREKETASQKAAQGTLAA